MKDKTDLLIEALRGAAEHAQRQCSDTSPAALVLDALARYEKLTAVRCLNCGSVDCRCLAGKVVLVPLVETADDVCSRCGAKRMRTVGHPAGCAAEVLDPSDALLPYARHDCAKRAAAQTKGAPRGASYCWPHDYKGGLCSHCGARDPASFAG